MTNVEALKEVFIALGGNAEDFTATTNDEAIALIATVATVLPTVTSSDNGKVLAVVDGQWDKTELSGGVLLVHGTGSFADGWTMDKTPAEIQSAYNAGAFISFVLEGIDQHVIPTSIMFYSGTSGTANGYEITNYRFTNINVSDKEMVLIKDVYTVTNNGKMTPTSTIYHITVTNITTT